MYIHGAKNMTAPATEEYCRKSSAIGPKTLSLAYTPMSGTRSSTMFDKNSLSSVFGAMKGASLSWRSVEDMPKAESVLCRGTHVFSSVNNCWYWLMNCFSNAMNWVLLVVGFLWLCNSYEAIERFRSSPRYGSVAAISMGQEVRDGERNEKGLFFQ